MPTFLRRPGLISQLASLLLAVIVATSAHASAGPLKPVEPTVLQSPYGLTEVGLIDGAAYRIDIPTDWNHSLVVFYHGYSLRPATFHIAERPIAQQQIFLDRHFAVIQSAYSKTGWALEQAYPETEALRHYFVKKYGQPRESYIAGFSMGGDLVSITLELNPRPYLGGLDLCGAVGPTYASFNRRFAIRAAFDHYFPDVMPPLLAVPTDYEASPADTEKALSALRSNPAYATLLRNLAGLHTDAELAHDIAYFTFVVGDLEHRSGGNPFDNRNLIYTGTGLTSSASDVELNDHVKRYTANPTARQYLQRHYSPNGHLGRPMLALHTIYDPIVQISGLALYDQQVQMAGAGDNFIQQYVNRDGHCNFTLDQISNAFESLVRWTHHGPHPSPGLQK